MKTSEKTMEVHALEAAEGVATKAVPPVDKLALRDAVKKLMMARPPDAEPLVQVKVRCDHQAGKWIVEVEGKPTRQIATGVLAQVKLVSEFSRLGCGGEYNGWATGGLLHEGELGTTDGKQLTFDRWDGEFVCDRKQITEAAYLILLEKCQARAVLIPHTAGKPSS